MAIGAINAKLAPYFMGSPYLKEGFCLKDETISAFAIRLFFQDREIDADPKTYVVLTDKQVDAFVQFLNCKLIKVVDLTWPLDGLNEWTDIPFCSDASLIKIFDAIARIETIKAVLLSGLKINPKVKPYVTRLASCEHIEKIELSTPQTIDKRFNDQLRERKSRITLVEAMPLPLSQTDYKYHIQPYTLPSPIKRTIVEHIWYPELKRIISGTFTVPEPKPTREK